MGVNRNSRREEQDDSLMTPEEAFERAARIRLGLNREAKSKASAASFLAPAALDKAARDQSILDQIPGLTQEELDEVMDEA